MDDERHRREEAQRRAKRKMAQANLSESQLEKRRKRKEHAQRVLQKHGGGDSRKPRPPSTPPPPPPKSVISAFQELFSQRAKGFHIDFRFRNAPPRPPVGPCFVGDGLDGALREASKYRPMNTVEMMYRWKLHSEPDLGVPLAPLAMNPSLYNEPTETPELHEDDVALLDWKGSLGDTAAEELKQRRDNARAAARLALVGKSPGKNAVRLKYGPKSASATGKKAFSRVLDETMQSWMKKTTYLSNDYSRKVHDFKSLAKTKEQLADDLDVKRKDLARRRTPEGIDETFQQNRTPVAKHPTKKHLTPVAELPLLPNTEFWGHTFTHVIMDKSPGDEDKLGRSVVANVHQKNTGPKMSCQLFVPISESGARLQAIQQYDLDVVPLKEEDMPHIHFCIFIDRDAREASYLPISSRINLSTGRPLKKNNLEMMLTRREMDDEDRREVKEKLEEIDRDAASTSAPISSSSKTRRMQIHNDDSSDSDNEDTFMARNQTIVAED